MYIGYGWCFGYNGSQEKCSRTGSSRLIAVKWCTSRLRVIVFNDRISLAREGSSRFVLRSFATKGENQRRRKRKKQKDPPPRRNGDQLFPPEDPLNMHETIAYLMQLAERDLLPFLFLSICLLFLFSPVSLSRVSRAGFKTLSLSRSLSLFPSFAQPVSIFRPRMVENLL